MINNTVSILTLDENNRPWVREFTCEHWGDEMVVAHGVVYYPARLSGFLAESGGERVGLVTFQVQGKQCEVVTLDSLSSGMGVGTMLMDAVKQAAVQAGCTRLWLITTNDNLDALRFYQRRGFELAALHRGAVTEARKIKPAIPLAGAYDIPIRDEIELEMSL